MVRLIMGANGAGKTKQLIDLIHNAVEAENGSVVCMEVETGAQVMVPLFVNEGEVIKIDTRSGEYLSRA